MSYFNVLYKLLTLTNVLKFPNIGPNYSLSYYRLINPNGYKFNHSFYNFSFFIS